MLRYFNRLKRKKGFTMIELLVAVAVFGILVTMMAALVGPVSGLIMGARRDARIDAIVDNIGEYIKRSTDIATRVEIFEWRALEAPTLNGFNSIAEANMYLRNFSHCQYHAEKQYLCVILPCQLSGGGYYCGSAATPHTDAECALETKGFCGGCPNTDHHVPCVMQNCPKPNVAPLFEAANCVENPGSDTSCSDNHCQESNPLDPNYCDDSCKMTHCVIEAGGEACPNHKPCTFTRRGPAYDPVNLVPYPPLYDCAFSNPGKALLASTPVAEREYRIKGLYLDANGYLYDLGDITDGLSGPSVTNSYNYLMSMLGGVLRNINDDPDGVTARRTRVFIPDYYSPILCNEGIGYCEPYAPCDNCGINYVITPLPSGGLKISAQAMRNVPLPLNPNNRTEVTKGRVTSFNFINPYLEEPVFNRGRVNFNGDVNRVTNFLETDPPTGMAAPEPILILYTVKA